MEKQLNNKAEQKVIMYDSPEAATYRTDIKGWVSAGGIFCGDGEIGEQRARYRGATHTICQCGAVIRNRSYIKCEDCRWLALREAYNKLPYKEYDGSPVCTIDWDKYFFSEEEILDYLEDQEENEIDLLFCEGKSWTLVSPDFWSDDFPENSDGEMPKRMSEALDNLNTVIKGLPPAHYTAGKTRTTYKITDSNE